MDVLTIFTVIFLFISINLVALYLATIYIDRAEISLNKTPDTVAPIKTWQEYEAEKPKKITTGKRKVFYSDGETVGHSTWNAGRSRPSKEFKR